MKKIYIKHNGCLNLSYDFNITKSGLEKSGYEIVSNPNDAEEIVFAGCGVRAAWVDDAISQMNSFIEGKIAPKVTVTGCISKIETERIEKSVNSENVSFKSFQELVKEYTQFSFDLFEKDYSQNENTDLEGDNPLRRKVTPLKERVVRTLDQLDRKYELSLVDEYKRRTTGFFFYNETEPTEMITVSRSCLYNCSFCTIPKGRGDYRSIKLDDIKEKIRKAISKDIFRIVLIGDEVGNYGKDFKDGSNFHKLVEEVLAIDERLKIAIRYIEPTPFLKNFEMLKKYCLEGRIYLLHVPLQTGSQDLLKQMSRNYKLEKIIPYYKDLIENTETVFYCNWMIGFPGETEEDFQKTVDLASYLQIHLNTVIPFSARPDTKAFARLDKISTEIIEDRCSRLENVLLSNKLNNFKELTPDISEKESNEMLEIISVAEFTKLQKLQG